MIWTFLRMGWGNTATIFALGLLPIAVLANVALDHNAIRQDRANLEITIADEAAIVTIFASVD